MSSAHVPNRLGEIEAIAKGVINGDCEASVRELVEMFNICVEKHDLRIRDLVCRAINTAAEQEGIWS